MLGSWLHSCCSKHLVNKFGKMLNYYSHFFIHFPVKIVVYTTFYFSKSCKVRINLIYSYLNLIKWDRWGHSECFVDLLLWFLGQYFLIQSSGTPRQSMLLLPPNPLRVGMCEAACRGTFYPWLYCRYRRYFACYSVGPLHVITGYMQSVFASWMQL